MKQKLALISMSIKMMKSRYILSNGKFNSTKSLIITKHLMKANINFCLKYQTSKQNLINPSIDVIERQVKFN